MRHETLFKNQSGGVAILTGFALFLLILTMAVSIETGRAFLLRKKAVNALDGAVLAAAGVATSDASPQDLQNRAQAFFTANFPDGYLKSTTSPLVIVWDKSTKKIRSEMNLSLPLYFGGFLPIDHMNMHIFSETTRVVRSAEIALVLDHTGSLCDPDCSASDKIVEAVTLLFKRLKSLPTPADADTNPRVPQYSYIPFNHSVNINGVPHWKLSDSDFSDAVDLLPSAMGLTPVANDILTRMKNFPVIPDEPGGTNTSIGTWYGWRSLRTQAQDKNIFSKGLTVHRNPNVHPAPFPYDGIPPYDPNDPTFKFIIILTDGNNEFWVNGKPYTDFLANSDQKVFCDGIKSQGIEIFTIAFGIDKAVGKENLIRDIFRDCASDEKPDHYFEPDKDGTDLAKVFDRIADRISSLVITQ
ncbi:MAG: pilus assembly protein TadG-related protein [Rickettsiales bacterium]